MDGVRIDATLQEAAGPSARSLPFGGGCAIAIGGVLLGLAAMFGVGVAILIVLRPDAEQVWMVPPAVLFLFLVGAGLVRLGIRDNRRQARGKEMAFLHPEQPWFADWTWDPQGVQAESEWGGASLFVVLFVLLIAAPFNVLWLHVFDPKEEPTMRLMALMVLIPDFFMYLVAKGLVSIAYDRVRFGRPFLGFDVFPFPLGGWLRGRLTARRFEGQTGVRATLRCIDERMATQRESGGGSVDMVKPYQVHEVRWDFPGTFAGRNVTLDLPLPEEPATQLLRQPPLYWELEIAGSNPQDTVRFIVPVYADPPR